MKRLIQIITLLIVFAIPVRAGVAEHQFEDYCRVFGAIYWTNIPGEADYKVYIQEDEAFADYQVFLQETVGFADQTGQWYITEGRGFADYILYRVDEPGYADFSIYYTDTESFAGCYD